MPVCAPCKREFKCDKNSVRVDYGDSQFRSADRYVCPGCGTKIVVGFCREVYELPADVPVFHDTYQRVEQPDFPDYKPVFREPTIHVRAVKP